MFYKYNASKQTESLTINSLFPIAYCVFHSKMRLEIGIG